MKLRALLAVLLLLAAPTAANVYSGVRVNPPLAIAIDIDGEVSFTDQSSMQGGTFTCNDWPCPVMVWALDTTAPSFTSNPKHDLRYRWDFDDDAAGTRTIAGLAFDKDKPPSPQAFYRYASSSFPDTCGADACKRHVATLTVTGVTGGALQAVVASFTVEEISPDALYPTTSTACYCNEATCTDDPGCPSGAANGGDVSTTASGALNDCDSGTKRIAFEGGVTFTGLGNQSFDTTNRCLVTSYGGARAILSHSWTGTSPFRVGDGAGGTVFHDISIAGSGAAETSGAFSKVVSPSAEDASNLLLSDIDLGTSGNGLHKAVDFSGGGSDNLHNRIYVYGATQVITGTAGTRTPINSFRVLSGSVANSSLTGATTTDTSEHLIRLYLTTNFVADLNVYDGAGFDKNHQLTWRASTGATSRNLSVTRSAFIVHRNDSATEDPTTPLHLCASNDADVDIREFYDAWVTQNIFYPGAATLDRRNYVLLKPLTGGGSSACTGIDIWQNVFQQTVSASLAVGRGVEEQSGGKSNNRFFNNACFSGATSGVVDIYCADMTAASGNTCEDNVGLFASGAIDGCGSIADTGNTFVASPDPFDFTAGDPSSPTANWNEFKITTSSAAEGTGVLDATDRDAFGNVCPQDAADRGVHCVAN